MNPIPDLIGFAYDLVSLVETHIKFRSNQIVGVTLLGSALACESSVYPTENISE
jgi:hypothetical protein